MAAPNQLPSASPGEPKLPANLDSRTYQELKISLHRYLLNRLDLEKIAAADDEPTRWQAFAVIQEVVSQIKVPFTPQEREQFSRTILDEVFALGPLEPLLQDPTVDDILVNGAKEVYVERAGMLEETKVVFKDDAHLMRIIQKIVAAIGRRIDASSPMVDARLADGSRVNIIIPPLAIDGPHISIRRFGHIPITDADLLASQALTPHMLGLLKASVAARLNVIISGGTGAGKTTLLNVLSGYISTKERIVTIEDSAELQLKQRHVVRLECRPPNPEGNGAVQRAPARHQQPAHAARPHRRRRSSRRRSARHAAGHEHRPRRIDDHHPRQQPARRSRPHGNHGHDGEPQLARARRPQADRVGHQPDRAGRALHRRHAPHHVHHRNHRDGIRQSSACRIIFVFEKQGMTPDGKVIGNFVSTGIRPKFAERLKAAGFELPSEMFDNPAGRWR